MPCGSSGGRAAIGKRGRAGAGRQVLASEVVQRWMRARETAPDSTAGCRQSRRGATAQLGVMRWGAAGEQSKKGAAPEQIWSRTEKTAMPRTAGQLLEGSEATAEATRSRGACGHPKLQGCLHLRRRVSGARLGICADECRALGSAFCGSAWGLLFTGFE